MHDLLLLQASCLRVYGKDLKRPIFIEFVTSHTLPLYISFCLRAMIRDGSTKASCRSPTVALDAIVTCAPIVFMPHCCKV